MAEKLVQRGPVKQIKDHQAPHPKNGIFPVALKEEKKSSLPEPE